MNAITNDTHPILAGESWIEARKTLLAREKELMRLHDQVAAERRALPWRRIDKDYLFDTPQGPRRLSELFGERRQLMVQHFMFGPDWEEGCQSCSFMADHTDGMTIHLAQRDISFVAVSRAPLAKIKAFRERMGWRFDWVSSYCSDFNRDFGVSFTAEQLSAGPVYYNYTMQTLPAEEVPGISVFYKDETGQVFHTYSTFGRGVEVMMGAYALIDLTPKGRAERDVFYKMEWLRHHDRYQPSPQAASCCHAGGE